jgi:alpha-N-arabinofuranosidase
MKYKKLLGSVGKLVVAGTLCSVFSGFSQSTVTINVSGATSVVAKEMFGVLMERLGRQWGNTAGNNGGIWVTTGSTIPNTNGMRNDVINGFAECGVGSAQWPGGCAATSYTWSPPNPTNDVGTDRFIQFCQLTGATPVICGPRDAAASNLAWIKHIDSQMTSRGMGNLKWFKNGNEVWGGCGNGITVGTYTPMFTSLYNVVHPYRADLNLEACNDMEGNWGWMTTEINSIGSQMNGLEYHDYVYRTTWNATTTPVDQYWQIMYDASVGDFAGHIRTNVIPAMNAANADKRIKLVVDEWGDWLAGNNWMQQINIFDAISGAMQLHLMMSNADRIAVACLAQGVSVIHSVINISDVSPFTMVKTPMFYVFKMFKPHHTRNAKWAPISTSSIQTFQQATASSGTVTLPILNVGATVDSLQRVNISISSMDITASRQITITLTSGVTTYVLDSAQVIQGTGINSTNAFGAAESVNIQNFAASNYTLTGNGKILTVTVPPLSIVMLRVQPIVAVQPGSIRMKGADAFSIKAGSRGTVLVSSLVSQKTPVTISLYGVDGRTLMDRVSKTFEPGNSTCVLGSNGKGREVYIVKITGTDINLSKKVVVAR